MQSATSALASIGEWTVTRAPFYQRRREDVVIRSRQTPTTSRSRQQASLSDVPVDTESLLCDVSQNRTNGESTVLYLGYGSNLSAETFLGKRGIKPLSQVNVVVPEIAISFNLPGIPYTEPCFANTIYRTDAAHEKSSVDGLDYHKDRWHKGLVGVCYEVTMNDFAHIIATEGGGSGYKDVLVDCYQLASNPKEKVPMEPDQQSFKAHTLFAPANVERPDHSYAQPSARYLKLITDGAAEHSLPYEYQDFLHKIRTYHTTSTKQKLGQYIFLMIWQPIFAFVFGGLAAIFLKPDGRYPTWFQKLARACFAGCWGSYDNFFKPLFGDGERTVKEPRDRKTGVSDDEKAPLIRESIDRYGVGGRLETGV